MFTYDYLTALSVSQSIQERMLRWVMKWNLYGLSDRHQLQGQVHMHWNDWEKLQKKLKSWYSMSLPKFELDISRKRFRSATSSAIGNTPGLSQVVSYIQWQMEGLHALQWFTLSLMTKQTANTSRSVHGLEFSRYSYSDAEVIPSLSVCDFFTMIFVFCAQIWTQECAGHFRMTAYLLEYLIFQTNC